MLKHPPDAVKGYFEAALRHNQGDPAIIAEYGAYLFKNGFTAEAGVVFDRGKQLRCSSAEKSKIRFAWKDDSGNRKIFSGRVTEIRSGVGFVIAVPENFTAQYWRTRDRLADLRQGAPVRFTIGFSAQGPRAERFIF